MASNRDKEDVSKHSCDEQEQAESENNDSKRKHSQDEVDSELGSRNTSPSPKRKKRDESDSVSRSAGNKSKKSKKHKKHRKHKKRSSASCHGSDSSYLPRRKISDSISTLSYGPGSHVASSWSTNKEKELLHLRDLVKSQNVVRYPDEFSFSPSEAQSVAHSFVSRDDTFDQPRPSQSTSIEDVIFEGVHKEPKGKPLGKVSLQLIEDWYAKDVDSEYLKKLRDLYAEPENTEHLSSKVMNSEIFRPLPENVKKTRFLLQSSAI